MSKDNEENTLVDVSPQSGTEADAVTGDLLAALEEIANDPHCSYENTEGGSYGIGVTDGHRCAATKARAAIARFMGEPTESANAA